MYMFLFQKMSRHLHSVDSQVLGRINSKGKGWVFTPSDFQDLGSQSAVAIALMRHSRTGVIRQLARGLYDYPDHDPRIGLLSPSIDAIAQALNKEWDREAIRAHAEANTWDTRVVTLVNEFRTLVNEGVQ